MAKEPISKVDLAQLFRERMNEHPECPPGASAEQDMTIITAYGNLIKLQATLSTLTNDIRELRSHDDRPIAALLEHAPLLEQWSFAIIQRPCLMGAVEGHPLLGDLSRMHTSELFAIDQAAGWARTWSRRTTVVDPTRFQREWRQISMVIWKLRCT